jgi:DNA (cytosine-5)-methyltransferase 1
MVGFKDKNIKFEFPELQSLILTMSDIWGGECPKKVGYTLRVGGRGSKIDDRRNWDSYLVDGKVKRLGVEEGKKM